MTLKEPGSAECLAAYVALVAQVVSEHVHGECRHGYVRLMTGGALPGLLAVQTAVRLLVATQVGGGGIGFAALAARVTSWPL